MRIVHTNDCQNRKPEEKAKAEEFLRFFFVFTRLVPPCYLQSKPEHPLRTDQGGRVVGRRQQVLDGGAQQPEGVLFFEQQQQHGGDDADALAVAQVRVQPAESTQQATQSACDQIRDESSNSDQTTRKEP